MDSSSPLFSTEGSLMESDAAFLSTTLGIVLLIVAAVAVVMCLVNTASALWDECCGSAYPSEGRTHEHRLCLSRASQLALAFTNAALVVGLLSYCWTAVSDMKAGLRWGLTIFMALYFLSMVYIAIEIIVYAARDTHPHVHRNRGPAPVVIGMG